MAYEAYYVGQIIRNCEWYFGRKVQLIMFAKESITHCVVVPAQSALGFSTQRRASDILISSSSEKYPLYTLHNKIKDMIGTVFTVSESGEYGIDESKVPPECLMPDNTSTRNPSPDADGPKTSATSMPRTDTKQPTLGQDVPDLGTNSQSTVESAYRPTAAGKMQILPSTRNEPDITKPTRQIPGTPVSVEDIWPFIQDIAREVSRQGVECGLNDDGAMRRLSTMSLDDIQISGSNPVTSSASPLIHHAPESIRMPTPSSHGVKDYHEPPRPTVLTPSTYTTTDGSGTPTAEPDEAAQLNRDIIREEINRALAGAMANLAGLLSFDVGRAT